MAELKIAFSIVCNVLIAYTSVFLNLCNTHELWLLSGEEGRRFPSLLRPGAGWAPIPSQELQQQ